MKFKDIIKKTLSGIYASIKRFPAALVFSASTAAMLIAISELQPINNKVLEETLQRITMVLGLGIPLSLCLKLIYERNEGKRANKAPFYYAAGALILPAYYILFLGTFNMVSATRYAAVLLALTLVFLYAPFFLKKDKYELYIVKVLSRFFTTALYSIVLFLGLAAILFTIDKLLSVNIPSDFYLYTWLLVIFVFAPSFFLSGIPLENNGDKNRAYPNLLKILVLYIVMPLLAVYTAILYIYFIRILVTAQWPVGLVAHLVLWYSVIAVSVLFLAAPLREHNKWADRFTVWFPRLILPILLMMFVSIGIRVKAYGITENRYFVIILGIWVSGMMLYYALVKKVRNILLPVTLSVIILISVFGPLSSYSVSKFSQNSRFEKILVKNGMLKEGKIQQPQAAIPQEDKREISSILGYFMRNHSLTDVRYLPDNFTLEDMNKVFGFLYEDSRYYPPEAYFQYTRDPSEKGLDIAGYNYMFDARSLYGEGQPPESGLGVLYGQDSQEVKIIFDRDMIYSMDLNPYIKELAAKYGKAEKQTYLPADVLMLTGENDKVRVKIVFNSISGTISPTGLDPRAQAMDFYVLVSLR